MTQRLKDLVLSELSFVGKAANRHARISICKSEEPHASAPITKMANAFSVEQPEDNMTAFTKAEADLNALVTKRLAQNEDESEAVAMAKVLQTPEGKHAYAAMAYSHDIEVAKSTTLLTFGNRAVEKIGGHSVAERTAVTDALEKLDAMAKAEASKTGQTYFQAYARILATESGKALYSVTCAKPSLASGAAA
jgi:hypothetical protein